MRFPNRTSDEPTSPCGLFRLWQCYSTPAAQLRTSWASRRRLARSAAWRPPGGTRTPRPREQAPQRRRRSAGGWRASSSAQSDERRVPPSPLVFRPYLRKKHGVQIGMNSWPDLRSEQARRSIGNLCTSLEQLHRRAFKVEVSKDTEAQTRYANRSAPAPRREMPDHPWPSRRTPARVRAGGGLV